MNLNGLSAAGPASSRTAAVWEAADWSVVVGHKGLQRRFTQSLPYARVGSHPGCEVVLDNPRLPPVAYLLVAFRGHVEAWPVAPIAMPRWGALTDGEEFPVGTFRISVELDEPPARDDAAGERYPELGVVVGSRRWAAKLHRRVTIVGDDHPSVKRLRDVGLQACHGAFVAAYQQLWYLPLSPQDAPYLTGRSLAVELGDGEYVETGRVRFLRLSEPKAADEPNAAAERAAKVQPAADERAAKGPPLDEAPLEVPPVAAESPEVAEPMVEVESGEVESGEVEPVGERGAAGAPSVRSAAIDSLMQGLSGPLPDARSRSLPPASSPAAKPREVCPDGLTHQVTERMVQLGRRRVIKARLLLGTAVSLAVISAVIVLLKIWNSLTAG